MHGWSKRQRAYQYLLAWCVVVCAGRQLPYIALAQCTPISRTSSVLTDNTAAPGDIILVSTPHSPARAFDGSDLMVYAPDGMLKSSVHMDFSLGSAPGTLGISGNGEYAFLGSGLSNGRVAITRIAGGNPKFLGVFNGGSNIGLEETGSIAMGSNSGDGTGSVYVSEGVSSQACKMSNGQSIATRVVELQFTPERNSVKAKLTRNKTFDVYRSSNCSERSNVVLGLRSIRDSGLYVVLEEKLGAYSMRRFNPGSTKMIKSAPIVTYSASAISSVTIDSPISFVAQGLGPGTIPGYFAPQTQIRIERGRPPVYGTQAPGQPNSNGPRLFSGGMSSYPNGRGIVSATGTLNNHGYGPIGNTVYKFDSQTLKNPTKLFKLAPAVMLQDLLVVPKPQPTSNGGE